MIKHYKEPLSVTKQYTIQYTANGFFWLIYSICNLIPIIPAKIVGALFLILASICLFIILFAKKEPDDEMSSAHIAKAQSTSLEILICLIMFAGILSFYKPFSFNKTYGFFIAFAQLFSGLLFRSYEREGDY